MSWAASTVYSVGEQGLADTADFVGQHWRGLVQAALFVGVMALGMGAIFQAAQGPLLKKFFPPRR